MYIVFICIFLLFFIYNIIPNFYYRNIYKSTIKKFKTDKKNIAITFDDGPDYRYTPILLDLLKKYNVKCTFFLVAEKAYNNKELVIKIKEDGHSIGLHSLKHKSAWLSFPFETKKDFDCSIKYLSDINVKVDFIRPPWGTFNILTQYYINKYNLTTVLWSINAADWSKKTTVDDIINKVIYRIKPGDILVLHDSNGAEGAPLKTISALEKIIPELLNEGYEFVTINQIQNNIDTTPFIKVP
ncbi:MAG: polysaccharide deacetylase family protein [Bacillota bacterium]|nr:polysaccharide deacetylase family protein [Bacillota bacterium]